MPDNVLFAFALTLFAGLSTGVGSALAFFNRRHNEKFLASALGFSAGVMLYVSFMEIMPKATEALARDMPGGSASWLSAAAFFGGVLLAGVIDRLVPSYENPHEIHRVEEMDDPSERARFQKLYKTGLFTALAIAIHNFPEGLATFIAALDDPSLGVPIAVAIAIHNIPEGIAVSVPIYYATSSRRRAFFLSFASGLSEPLGALVGFLLLMPFLNGIMFGLLFASVAGIMVFISLDELLPAAREYGEHHLSIYGLVAGMAVMAASLLLFQ
ncbi:zinc transporter ZupT [Desulfohalovibrio reitneri]|uniref:zinc transporter ZupT n=1 Tax=Desulfohalovibrio reitneri TaxID=1307759 RepID=UPI0004A70F29|nr:zinc transporter ZupT [Desulfohalovibrio reitneri]